jgi:hypothetical protein
VGGREGVRERGIEERKRGEGREVKESKRHETANL